MDETNLPLEAGLETRAITYNKGCYIGQEVINRIHSVGHVNRELRGLRLATAPDQLPRRGDKLFHAGKEVGHITSAVQSPALHAPIALAYIRREASQIGTELTLKMATAETQAKVASLPFV
jgi:folate-binding protein YgfZ